MYNNPFLYQSIRPSLFSRLFRGGLFRNLNWGNILNNTQKSLGIINQAIPLVYQVKPIINNAKTMFKIADAMKSSDRIEKTTTNNTKETVSNSDTSDINKPVFYI